jgi:hypothetical protein
VKPESNLIVLCQPDAGKSCGACCGLYNYVDSSREALTQRLRARTKRFRELVKTPGDVECYAGETFASEDFRMRYEVIYRRLVSVFNNAPEIEQAQNLIWSNIEKFLSAYRRYF